VLIPSFVYWTSNAADNFCANRGVLWVTWIKIQAYKVGRAYGTFI